jgi:hypothetical protein
LLLTVEDDSLDRGREELRRDPKRAIFDWRRRSNGEKSKENASGTGV